MEGRIWFCALLLASCAFGHEDPWGDVNPTIVVENGEFAVWFVNNKLLPDGSKPETTRIKAKVSPNGGELLERQETAESPPLQGAFGDTTEPMNGGVGLQAGWQNGAQDLDGFCQSGDRLFFHMSPFPQGKENPAMYLAEYDLAAKRLTSWVPVGIPGRLYYFAVASRTIYHKGHVYVAWIEQRDRKQQTVSGPDGVAMQVVSRKTQVVLTKWKPGAPASVHLPIRQTLDGNSHLDIAASGDKLLIAWHEGIGMSESSIGTALVDVSQAPFEKEISYSPIPTIHQERLRKMELDRKEAQRAALNPEQ